MKLTIVLACVVLLGTTCSAQILLTSCARMNDGAIGEKVAQAACISSCKFQNCGTGSCQYRGRPVCVCSRCDKGGGEWPSIPSKGK